VRSLRQDRAAQYWPGQTSEELTLTQTLLPVEQQHKREAFFSREFENKFVEQEAELGQDTHLKTDLSHYALFQNKTTYIYFSYAITCSPREE
jgi:hypothetical protein